MDSKDEIPFQIAQIQRQLSRDFFDHIELTPEEQKSDEGHQLNYKFTRSLVGMLICMNSNLSPEQACQHITDGFGDNGIDGLFYNKEENTFYVIQSKFNKKGEAIFDRSDALKFVAGVKDLTIPRLENFGAKTKILAKKGEIDRMLSDAHVRIILAVITAGNQQMSPNVKSILDDFIIENNQYDETFSILQVNNKDMYRYISKGAAGKPINADVVIGNWAGMTDPIKTFFGQIAGSDLALLFDEHGRRLFEPNIRFYLGNTEVNGGIMQTIADSPNKFWYYNNGITILCDSVDKKQLGGNNPKIGYFFVQTSEL